MKNYNERFYIGHKVLISTDFIGYEYEGSNLEGCGVETNYYISKEFTLLSYSGEGYYIDKNGDIVELLDSNSFVEYMNMRTLKCDNCNHFDGTKMINCMHQADCNEEIIGVVDVQPLHSFDENLGMDMLLYLVNHHNEQHKNEYILVTDITYGEVIKEIDENSFLSQLPKSKGTIKVLKINNKR